MIDTPNTSSIRDLEESLRASFEELSKDYKIEDAHDFWLAHRFLEAMSDMALAASFSREIGAATYVIRTAMMAASTALFEAIERTAPELVDVQLPNADAEDLFDLLCKHFGEDPADLR